ncbi:DUF3078 domain-containing protein [Flavobacteriaceae bacterium]|nr:DUF3078 domain-containing protein [Flavobacteriaceae bacterium]MDB4164064.1 DUF3078 domain-containing protein [Flavobacteriaceae bacterium]MDC1336304.1 DUF3078 domain-containing protein [Flavobacteriaceae bacterium]MDC1456742.1 DUF3078 domain-containing protein [Flavobacteriaceae bacterium]
MKLKIYHLLSLLFISTLVFSQDEIEDKKWKKSGNAVFLVNQSSFSNWTSGGQSSISGTLKVDYNYNYSDNGWAWDTKIFSNFGLNKISGSEFLKKTDDRIEVNSVLGKKFNNDVIGKWSYSSFFNFQTQFAKGYRFGKDSNGNPNRTEKSRFFSPATLQLGVGLYWKKSKDFWVNVAPMTGKLILVNRFFTETLNENETYFGVKKGGNSRFELGASVRAYYKSEIFKNINLENRLSLYSDYLDRPQNVDFDCTFNFVMKVNQYISTNLIFQFVYDDNEIKRVQIREVLGLGLNIDLSNIRI